MSANASVWELLRLEITLEWSFTLILWADGGGALKSKKNLSSALFLLDPQARLGFPTCLGLKKTNPAFLALEFFVPSFSRTRWR